MRESLQHFSSHLLTLLFWCGPAALGHFSTHKNVNVTSAVALTTWIIFLGIWAITSTCCYYRWPVKWLISKSSLTQLETGLQQRPAGQTNEQPDKLTGCEQIHSSAMFPKLTLFGANVKTDRKISIAFIWPTKSLRQHSVVHNITEHTGFLLGWPDESGWNSGQGSLGWAWSPR